MIKSGYGLYSPIEGIQMSIRINNIFFFLLLIHSSGNEETYSNGIKIDHLKIVC